MKGSALVLAGLLGLVPAVSGAALVAVDVRLEPAEVFLGSPARLEVAVTGPPDLEVDFSGLGTRMGSLEGARPMPRPANEGAKARTYRAAVELRSFVLSAGPSDPVTAAVPWKAGGESGVLTVWLPHLAVREVPRGPQEAEGTLRGPVGPVDLDEGLAIFSMLGATLGAALVAYFLLRRRGPSVLPPPVPVEDPWVLALRQLAELEARGDGGDPRAFHYRLSEIVRTCMVGRFGLAGLAETSDELLQECEAGGVPGPICQLAKQVLTVLDLVKFGPDEAAPGATAWSMDSCRGLVAGCTPPEKGRG